MMTIDLLPFRRPALLLGLAAAAVACEPKLDTAPTPSKGSADFSRYIAVGNSLTAGFGDNGLYRDGQLNSYPSILAGQFAQAGGGAFTQPLFTEAEANGTGYLRLTGFDANGSPVLTPVTSQLAVRATTPQTLYTQYLGPINNLGVPGLRMSEIKAKSLGNAASTSGPFNALFERITSTPNQTYLERVATANPTFFTCWLGNNDVLGFATSGGALEVLSPGSYGLTDTVTFRRNAYELVDTLTAHGAKGVVGNIPNVAAVPFFNTVGPKVKELLQSRSVPQMVATTGAFDLFGTPSRVTFPTSDIKDAKGGRQLFTLTGSSYVSLIGQPTGKYWRDFYAQLGTALPSFVTFQYMYSQWSLDTTQAFGVSAGNPWPSTLLLDDVEQGRVQARTTDFNNLLRQKAEAKGLAYFDANTFFNGISANGLATNSVNNSTAYISGNLFSLDGVHPTPHGYAVVANELLRIINAKYGSSLAPVDPNHYRAVRLP